MFQHLLFSASQWDGLTLSLLITFSYFSSKCGKSNGPKSRNTYSTYQVKDHCTVSIMQEPNLTGLFYLPLKYFIWSSQYSQFSSA